MGYRHYFHKISKTDLEEIKNCQTQIDLCEWSKRHNYNLERHEDDDGEHYDYIVVREIGKELYCFGKDVDWANNIQSKNESIFSNNELQEFYSDYQPVICSKEDFLDVINIYKQQIIQYYEYLLEPAKNDSEVSIKDKQMTHITFRLQDWKNNYNLQPINTDLTKDTICDSWLFEYAIFELVRIYKTFDWENDALILLGW